MPSGEHDVHVSSATRKPYMCPTPHLDALRGGLRPAVHLNHTGRQVLDVPGVAIDLLNGDAL